MERVGLPEDWIDVRLKDAVSFRQESLPENTNPNYRFRYVDIGSVEHIEGIREYKEISFAEAPSRARKKVRTGDSIVSTVRTYLKAIAPIDDDSDVIVSTGFSVLEPKLCTPRYLTYLLESDYFCEEVNRLSWGVSYPAISESLMGQIHVNLPPKNEQKEITAFLDSKTSTIDNTSEVLLRQIDVLERYKKSLIHEAVTKGLDPDAPLKPSGVEWFSTIPEGWYVKPYKHIASVAANLVEPANYAIEIQIDPENIESDSGRLLNILTVEEVGSISAKQRFVKGQILYSKIRPALNKVTIAPADGLCSADMYPITTKENSRWLRYFMASDAFVSQAVLHSMRVAMPKINVEKLGTVKVAVPSIHEQQAIADYLDEKCAKVDTILDIKRKQVEILKKRRQSLIYEYVTGKRRVGEKA